MIDEIIKQYCFFLETQGRKVFLILVQNDKTQEYFGFAQYMIFTKRSIIIFLADHADCADFFS